MENNYLIPFFKDAKKFKKFIGLVLGPNLKLRKQTKKYKESYAFYTMVGSYPYFSQIRKDCDTICEKYGSIELKGQKVQFKTKPNKALTALYKEFYNEEGRKIIPKTIDNYMSLDLIGMLYLECGNEVTRDFIFDISHYDKESIENLKNSLKNIIGISTIICSSKKKIELKISDEASKKLLNSYVFNLKLQWFRGQNENGINKK